MTKTTNGKTKLTKSVSKNGILGCGFAMTVILITISYFTGLLTTLGLMIVRFIKKHL